MKMRLPILLLSLAAAALVAQGCATGDTARTQPAQTTEPPATTTADEQIPPKERAALEEKFCTATLEQLRNDPDRQVPDDCKGVVMRRTEQFGHGENNGYLVTVIVGEDREKIDLGAVVTPAGQVELRSLQTGLNRAAVQEAELGIRNLQTKIDEFFLQSEPRRLPDSLEELEQQNVVDNLPTDPWGNAYIYTKKSATDYEIYSAGPDGQKGTLDDVRVQ
ncbi:type II secretion system protein GspG [Persicimonas caeni]|nr:type II secretion system protein GspG [Persicimonas caeni]